MKTKILDCTIRDGGYLNDWAFEDTLVRDLYSAVSKSGTDYVEIGFRNSQEYVDTSKLGIWTTTPENVVERVVKNNSGSKISLMIDYGKEDLNCIPNSSESKVSLYRVAAHKNKILEALSLVEKIADKGYEVALQLMGVSRYNENDFVNIIKPIKESKLTYLYFADSYGSILPNEIKGYMEVLRETGKLLGFHPHNNMQLALANTLEAIDLGIDIVDGTVAGMGRGAGNMQLETLIAFFQKSISEEKYNVLPILELINRHFLSLKKKHPWGYSLPYMISGVYEVHPNYAKNLSEGNYSIEDTRLALKVINELDSTGFDGDILTKISGTGFIRKQLKPSKLKESKNKKDNKILKPDYFRRHKNRNFLVLVNGPSLVEYKSKINRFIDELNPILIGTNSLGGHFTPDYHVFNNKVIFEKHLNEVSKESTLLLSNSFDKKYILDKTDLNYEIIKTLNLTENHFNIDKGVFNINFEAVSVLSIAVSIAMGASQVYVAGMDGYKDFETFYELAFQESNQKELIKKNEIDISNRSGTFNEQMAWHNNVDKSLKQINDYLVTNNLNDLLIITPTSHKMYYLGISNCLSSN